MALSGLSRAFPATITILNTNDSGPGSLRDAIQDAISGDSIDLAVTGTIVLTNGELLITKNLTIVGPVAHLLSLSGNHTSRIFRISTNAVCSMSGLTISDGRSGAGAPGLDASTPGGPGGDGGGILNEGRLELRDCILTNNHAGDGGYGYSYVEGSIPSAGAFGRGGIGGRGGAVFNSGTLVLNGCTLARNQAGNGGGGGWPNDYFLVANGGDGGLGGNGGAIYTHGTTLIADCEFLLNRGGTGGAGGPGSSIMAGNGGDGGHGGSGGAIGGGGTNYIANCRFEGNDAGTGGRGGNGGDGGHGGAVYMEATMTMVTCVFLSNQAASGGVAGSGQSYYVGAGGRGGDGGAIWGKETMFITNCAFFLNKSGDGASNAYSNFASSYSFPSGNTPDGGDGAGVFCLGNLTMVGCTLASNHCGQGSSGTFGSNPLYGAGGARGGNGGRGGGLLNGALANAFLLGCTVCGNEGGPGGNGGGANAPTIAQGGEGGSGGGGGGICNYGSIELLSSTLASNSGGEGGNGGSAYNALSAYGGSGGAGGSGGGILGLTNSSLSTMSALFASNSSGGGGGGGNGNTPGAQGASGAGPDVSGSASSQGFNFVSQTNGSSGWLSYDLAGDFDSPLNPLLGPLTNNGGLTPTMALLPGSPAIDQGRSSGLVADQRGRSRAYDNPAVSNAAGGDGTDIGAFELQSPAPVFTRLALAGTNVWLNLLTEVGWSYRVERSSSLTETNWTVVVDALSGTGAELRVVDSAAANFPTLFYRAQTVPAMDSPLQGSWDVNTAHWVNVTDTLTLNLNSLRYEISPRITGHQKHYRLAP